MSGPSSSRPATIGDNRQHSWLGGALMGAAMAILILAVAGRCFLGELGFNTSPLRSSYALLQMAGQKDALQMLPKELGEFSRVSVAILLMGAFCLGEIGRVVEKKASLIRRGPFGWLAAAFIAAIALSAWLADDQRSAWDCWLEQASLVMMFLLAVGLCEDKRRFALTAVAVAAIGAALAAKGLIQVAIEIPARIATFESDPAGTLAQLGYRPGTPEARLLESRIRDHTAIGFLPLANLFASMLMIALAAAAGLAADKLAVGRRQAVEFRMPKGRLSPMSAFGVLGVVISIVILAVLLMTRSRSGLAFAAAAGAVAVLAGIFRGFFARHRWTLVVVGLAVLFSGSAWLISYGMEHDRLPNKSMTFRWFYWTASAEIVKESGTATVLGVGPGNFPAAYLRHRRAEAEESIKMPHNTVAHAATEYGLVGGSIFIALLALALLGAAKKGKSQSPAADKSSGPLSEISNVLARRSLGEAGKSQIPAGGWSESECWSGWEKLLLALVVPCAAAARVYLIGWGDSAMLDVILPTIALAAGLWLFGGWALRAVAYGPGLTRMALGFGTFAFALHSLMEPNLWTPAPATLFWLAVGACLGQAERKGDLRTSLASNEPGAIVDYEDSARPKIGFMRPAFCIIVLCLLAACIQYIWRPVARKSMLNCKVQSAALAGDTDSAIDFAIQAAQADPFDRTATIDAAKLILIKVDRRNPRLCQNLICQASQLMEQTENKLAEQKHAKHIMLSSIIPGRTIKRINEERTTNDKSWNYLRQSLDWWGMDKWFGNFTFSPGMPVPTDGKSLEVAEQMVSQNPTDPLAVWTLGQMQYSRGNYLEAYLLFKKVDGLRPNTLSILAREGDAAWNANRKEGAFAAWYQAQAACRGQIFLLFDIGDSPLENDPMDSRLKIEYARWMEDLGWLENSFHLLMEAREIQTRIKAFNPESLELFSPAEWRELETLEARANFLLEYTKSQSVTQSAPVGPAIAPSQTQP